VAAKAKKTTPHSFPILRGRLLKINIVVERNGKKLFPILRGRLLK